MDVHRRLLENQDLGYRDFQSRLIPNVEKERIIGVRMPVLKQLAKEIYRAKKAEIFLKNLPHKFYEENNIHAYLISDIKDFDECIEEVNKFLPFVDNWATCDSLRPKCFKFNKKELLKYIFEWLDSDYTYIVRFGIEMLMLYYLDSDFEEEYPRCVSRIVSDDYYINMMIAWYFATALAKQYDNIVPYLKNRLLPAWIHKKTIVKACESFRISNDKKAYLKTLK